MRGPILKDCIVPRPREMTPNRIRCNSCKTIEQRPQTLSKSCSLLSTNTEHESCLLLSRWNYTIQCRYECFYRNRCCRMPAGKRTIESKQINTLSVKCTVNRLLLLLVIFVSLATMCSGIINHEQKILQTKSSNLIYILDASSSMSSSRWAYTMHLTASSMELAKQLLPQTWYVSFFNLYFPHCTNLWLSRSLSLLL